MTTPKLWPIDLIPEGVTVEKMVMNRGGGQPTLGGLTRQIRTDRGYWRITYKTVPVATPSIRRILEALSVELMGSSGLLAIPVWSDDTSEWLTGSDWGRFLTPHSDTSTFSDGSFYSQPVELLTMEAQAEIGATTVQIRLAEEIDSIAGIRFSYEHAMYAVGLPTSISGQLWTVPIFPSVRATIPAASRLEVGTPTCLVRLETDNEIYSALSSKRFDPIDISFVEAVDEWNDRASEA